MCCPQVDHYFLLPSARYIYQHHVVLVGLNIYHCSMLHVLPELPEHLTPTWHWDKTIQQIVVFPVTVC